LSHGPPDLAAAAQLGKLLRARREDLAPADVGLPAGRRRRTPGLRREEVADLASISTTYYALLEQGRARHPSPQVIDALATALGLVPSERAYLHALAAGESSAPPAHQARETLAPGVAELVARLDPHPTYVTGRRWDVLSSNRAARALWTDWPALAEPDRNLLLWMFAAPQAREVFVDWEHEAAAQLGRFRTAAALHLTDPGFGELIDRLLATGPKASAFWKRHDIVPLGGGRKRLRHPELGEITLQHVVLQVAENPDHKLVTFAPTPSDELRIAALISHADPTLTTRAARSTSHAAAHDRQSRTGPAQRASSSSTTTSCERPLRSSAAGSPRAC
jgi:transcriptional regulator with XRE-family HTH domain